MTPLSVSLPRQFIYVQIKGLCVFILQMSEKEQNHSLILYVLLKLKGSPSDIFTITPNLNYRAQLPCFKYLHLHYKLFLHYSNLNANYKMFKIISIP